MEEAFQLSVEVGKGFEHTVIWRKRSPGEKGQFVESPVKEVAKSTEEDIVSGGSDGRSS